MSTKEGSKSGISDETTKVEVQVWDLPYWANPPPVKPSEATDEEAPLSYPTVEEVEAIRQAAQDDGFQQGLIEGHQQGHEAGFAKGLAEGLAQGKQQGITQGHTEGRQQGFDQGLAEARTQVEREVAALKQVTQQLLEPIDQQQTALEAVLADLIEQSVKAVLRVPPHLTAQEIATIAHEALAALPLGAQNIKLYLSAIDHALMLEYWHGALPAALHIDESLTSGGCRVETATSLIDFSIEERLRQVLEALHLDHVPEHSPLTEIPATAEALASDQDKSVSNSSENNLDDSVGVHGQNPDKSGTDVQHATDGAGNTAGNMTGDFTDES